MKSGVKMNLKLQWLRNKISSLDIEGMIISNPINIKYLTNIDAEGVLLITPKEDKKQKKQSNMAIFVHYPYMQII